MIGRAPRWTIWVVGIVACIWVIPIIGIVVTSIRPPSEVALGWWRIDQLSFTLDAWFRVWDEYPLAKAFWTTAQLAAIATAATMLLTPAAAYAFHFLKFPFRRLLLIIIINAFVLPQQVVIIPLFQLWRDLGLIDNILSVLIPYVGLSFAWAIFLVKNFLEDFRRNWSRPPRSMAAARSPASGTWCCPTRCRRSSRSASCSSCGPGTRCCCPCSTSGPTSRCRCC